MRSRRHREETVEGLRKTLLDAIDERDALRAQLDQVHLANVEMRATVTEHHARREVLSDVSPHLIRELVHLGDTYGPLGVALVAARLSDPDVVCGELGID